LIIVQAAHAAEADYTGRNYVLPACELFAKDASQAAGNFSDGVALPKLLELIESVPVSDEEKDRAFQAIQLVWKNQLENPLLAYTVAMGLCLKPKEMMAPMDEPWITSPRTINEQF
jgi:hypothetical protein